MQLRNICFVCFSLIHAHVTVAFTNILKKSDSTILRVEAKNKVSFDEELSGTSRRSFFDILALTPVVLGLSVPSESAFASGGATAGGAYLLSAKQRYNERVRESVKGLLLVGKALAADSSKEAKEYFSSEEGASWKDLTAAGYLLSNAFRRSSTTPPDKLPAVQVGLYYVYVSGEVGV